LLALSILLPNIKVIPFLWPLEGRGPTETAFEKQAKIPFIVRRQKWSKKNTPLY
jgi:hypothetical protein